MKPIKTIAVLSILIVILIENLSQISSLLMKLCQSRNIMASIRGAAIRRIFTSRCKIEMLLLLNVSILFKPFHRLPDTHFENTLQGGPLKIAQLCSVANC